MAATVRESSALWLALLAGLQVLSDRIQALPELQPTSQTGLLVRELVKDMQDWRVGIQQGLGRLHADPATVDPAAFRKRVDARLARLEARVEEVLDQADDAQLSSEARGAMYRLLGAYRGVSEALVDFATQVPRVDWARLSGARF